MELEYEFSHRNETLYQAVQALLFLLYLGGLHYYVKFTVVAKTAIIISTQ